MSYVPTQSFRWAAALNMAMAIIALPLDRADIGAVNLSVTGVCILLEVWRARKLVVPGVGAPGTG